MDAQRAVDEYTSTYPARYGRTAYEGPSESGRALRVFLDESWPRAALLITTYPL